MKLYQEMRLLREQIGNDLDITWRMMGQMDNRIGEIAANVTRLANEVSEGFREARGRLRLADQRLGRFLEVLDAGQTQFDERLGRVEERLDRLESN